MNLLYTTSNYFEKLNKKTCFVKIMLKSIKTLLIWFGMCPPEISTAITKSIAHAVFRWIMIFLIGSALMAHSVIIWMYLNKNLRLSLAIFSITGIVSFSCIAYVLASAILTRNKIGNIFEKLSAIYDTSRFCFL